MHFLVLGHLQLNDGYVSGPYIWDQHYENTLLIIQILAVIEMLVH